MNYHYADLLVDTATHQVLQSGKPVMLTDTEYRLLVYLLLLDSSMCQDLMKTPVSMIAR